MKKTYRIILIFCFVLVLTSCIEVEFNIKINDDDSQTVDVRFTGPAIVATRSTDYVDKLKKDGFAVTTKIEGSNFIVEGTQTLSKGTWIFYGIRGGQNKIFEAGVQDYIFFKTYTFAGKYTYENEDKYDETTPFSSISIPLKYYIEIPGKINSHNAIKVSGNVLQWQYDLNNPKIEVDVYATSYKVNYTAIAIGTSILILLIAVILPRSANRKYMLIFMSGLLLPILVWIFAINEDASAPSNRSRVSQGTENLSAKNSSDDEARQHKARTMIELMETALKLYRLDNGFYPTTKQGLRALVEVPNIPPVPKNWREGGYLDPAKIPNDPWGNEFFYLCPGEHGDFDLASYGADGKSGGKGRNRDVTNWEYSDSSQNTAQGNDRDTKDSNKQVQTEYEKQRANIINRQTVSAGKINFVEVKERFRKSNVSGELLVISGLAMNEYDHPVSRVKLRAKIFDKAGVVLGVVDTYAGNLLTENELDRLNVEQMMEILLIPQGRDIANMNIHSRASIPFMFIFLNPPKEVDEFTIDLSGMERTKSR